MTIENLAWVLPRPGSSKYRGSFPLYFENKLFALLGFSKSDHLKILQPFGGKAEYGVRCDLKREPGPDIIADAHCLPFKDASFQCVLCDPPYSDELAKRLYKTPKLHFQKYVSEGVRVLKENGFFVWYHLYPPKPIRDTILIKRILLETRANQKIRCVHIYQKRSDLWTQDTQRQKECASFSPHCVGKGLF